MDQDDLRHAVAAVRRFNRFYTPLVGLLAEGYLHSSFSLTQVRVLYELAHRQQASAAELSRELRIDQAYLSRIVRSFAEDGMVDRRRSDTDGRTTVLTLTARGRETIEDLDRRSGDDIGAVLAPLAASDRKRVLAAMATIEAVLGPQSEPTEPYVIRPPASGDLGWVVERHGAVYAEEYGWDQTFEGLVAEIVAGFARGHDQQRERCWIAEMGGENIGSVFCVRRSDDAAQLRLLLVEPRARGRGIGRRLVDECIRFARAAGYRRLTLWTNDVLVSARRIYEAAGFRLVEEEPHHSFGHDLVGQNWELEL